MSLPATRPAEEATRGGGDPTDLGNTVAFRSSPKAGFVDGQSIVIGGGAGNANL